MLLPPTDFWVRRAKEGRINSQNVDYTNVNYSNAGENINLVCKLHNYSYTQRPSHHMANTEGCVHCMAQTVMYNDTTVVTHKDYIENIEGFLYVVNLSNELENFYKVGVTSKNRIEYRLNQLKKIIELL